MPLIQRNSLTFSNLVYTTGNYQNPQWLTSLSPAKVGSGVAQWNAAQIMGYPVGTSGAVSGEFLMFTGSGFKMFPASGGVGGSGTEYFADSGVRLVGDTFIMGGTGFLTSLTTTQTIPSNKVFVSKGAPAQTASVIEAQNSSSSVIFSVSPNGSFGCTLQSGNSIGFTMKSAVQQQFNYVEIQNDNADIVFAVTPSGSMSGTIAPAISGTSSNVTLDDSHNGYIVEYTGTSSGTITLGSISMPSWNCMVVNIGSGLSISGGSNTVRSPGNLLKSRTQYSSISIYRRANGEFLLGGDLA